MSDNTYVAKYLLTSRYSTKLQAQILYFKISDNTPDGLNKEINHIQININEAKETKILGR